MDYAAYLEIFKAELDNPTPRPYQAAGGGSIFGRPPLAGGVGGAKKMDPKATERKQVFEDLHADGRNVAEMSSQDQINEVFTTLKEVGKLIPEENNVIAEQMKALQLGQAQKETFFGISKILVENNVKTFVKAAFLAFTVKSAAELLKDTELVSMASSLMAK